MTADRHRARADAEELAARFAHRRATRHEFDASQLAALDALWRACRSREVTSDDARTIKAMILAGQVAGARKRLTNARRRGSSPD